MLHKLKGGNNLKYLIVVDMQNDFITGALGSREAQAIVSNVVAKIEKYRQAKCCDNEPIDIIFTHDTHKEDYLNTLEGKLLPIEHCIKDTYGWMLSDELPIDTYSDQHVYKHTFGYCGWSHILDRLSLDTSQDRKSVV